MALYKTLGDMRTLVRDGVDEDTASNWSDAKLNRAINKAAQRVWMECRALKDDFFLTSRTSLDGTATILGTSYATSDFAISVGVKTRTLPPDVAEVKLIECITSGYEHVVFEPSDLNDPWFVGNRMLTTNVSPSVFRWDIVDQRTLVLDVGSDTALDLRLWYVKILAEMSGDSSDLELPHPLYQAVEEYAISTAMMQDGNPNAAAHEARARQIIANFFGSHARQLGAQETAVGAFEGW